MAKKKEIKVFVKAPGERPALRTVENTLEALQGIVGGRICTVTLSDNLAAVANDDGIQLDLPYNCKMLGVIFRGTIVLVGVSGDRFTDCPRGVGLWYDNGVMRDVTPYSRRESEGEGA